MQDFWQISFFNLLQLFTNLFIAVIIAYYLGNRHSDKQIQKNLFLGVLNDIVKILEDELDFLVDFMRQTGKPKSKRQKVLLLLTKISNKITVLEDDNHLPDNKIKKLVTKIREHFDSVDDIIGAGDFVQANSFSDDSINKVVKNSNDIIFLIDQIKLDIFN
ncbi:MAG: hypothetical protein WC476_08565 [Phycisphaerae bacterium]